jgi:hypothetical protein
MEPVGTNRQLVIVLQLLVGALVTMGGALFAVFALNPLGTALGLVHFTSGVVGLLAGVMLLRSTAVSRRFLLAVNGWIISYSALSESIVQIASLPTSRVSIGSLIGTIIAIMMSCMIVYLLLKRGSAERS